MITISNHDRDFIVEYIDEMYARNQPSSLKESNLHRRAHMLAKKLRAKKVINKKTEYNE